VAGPRAEKVAAVEEVREQLERTDAAILTEYRGLKVGDLATLRRALRAAGAEYKIYKNTLVRRATVDTDQAVITPLLEGPTAIAFVEGDVAAVAKVLRDFARTNPALVVKGSFIGRDLLDARTTAALADLPSREVLLAQVAGAFAAPLRQFAGLVKALPQNLAYGISALIDQKRSAGDTSEAEAEAGDTSEAEAAPVPEADETAAGADANETAADEPASSEEAEAPSPTDPAAEEVSAEDADTAVHAEAEPEAETEPEAEPEPEAETEPEAESESEAESE
jgi:large subunit ribosomal protein L10